MPPSRVALHEPTFDSQLLSLNAYGLASWRSWLIAASHEWHRFEPIHLGEPSAEIEVGPFGGDFLDHGSILVCFGDAG
jgi:hypothetical protein